MNKKLREEVRLKYDNRCAYCGCELQKGWHVDHIEPIRRGDSDEMIDAMNKNRANPIVRGTNTIENYNPACRPCNVWKSTYTIEQFRKEIKEQVVRLNKYNANYRNAKRFGLIEETDYNVKFYFESIKFSME